MAENLLTVAALRTTVEADLIRSKLEAAGISAVLVEPELPADGAPPGRVQVQVSQPDFERAMQLLFPIPKMKPAARPAGVPRMPPPPLLPPGAPLPNMQPPPRISMTPGGASAVESTSPTSAEASAATVPPAATVIPPVASPAAQRPGMNGTSSGKAAPLSPPRRTRTAEDDGLNIVVPAWDPATGKGLSGPSSAKERSATEADDRAARRAWWTAVFGIVCPPLLLYSIAVVLILGLTNRPLSPRGNRFFYGALGLNTLLIAAFFIVSGMRP